MKISNNFDVLFATKDTTFGEETSLRIVTMWRRISFSLQETFINVDFATKTEGEIFFAKYHWRRRNLLLVMKMLAIVQFVI